MAFILFPKTFSPGDHLRGSDLNAVCDAIAGILNGGLSNANWSSNPLDRIDENKVNFNANTGHNHNGVGSNRIILPPIVMGLAGFVYVGLRTPPMELNENRKIDQVRVLANAPSNGITNVVLERLSKGETEWVFYQNWDLPAGETRLAENYQTTLNAGDLIRLRINTTNGTPPEGVTLQLWQNLT